MKKRCREDVEEQLRKMINLYRLAHGERPAAVTLTREDYSLMFRKDPYTREVIKPVAFDSVPIHVVG